MLVEPRLNCFREVERQKSTASLDARPLSSAHGALKGLVALVDGGRLCDFS